VTARGAAEDGVWAPGRRSLTAGLIGVITLVAAEAMSVATVLPLVEDDLGGLALYGWVFSAFFLGQLVGIVVAGRAADRVAPWVPFALGLALFALGLLLGGLAPSMLVLVLARALQGLGAGALPAVAYVAVARTYAPEVRPRMFALFSTAWIVPSLLGPALAGVVGATVGWRWVFLGLLPVLAVIGTWSASALRVVPVPDEAGARTPLRDALLVAGGATAVIAGLGADGMPVLGAGLVVVGLALAVPAFRRLTPPGTLRAAPGLPAAVAARGVLTFAFFAADAWVPFGLTDRQGLPVVVGGLALTAAAVTWTSAAWVQERFVRRVGPRLLVGRGFVILGVGVLGVAVAIGGVVPPGLGVGLWAVAGFGIGLAYAPISLTVLAEARSGEEGAATSALQLSDTLGIALGTGVAGAVVAVFEGTGRATGAALWVVFAVAAATALAGALVARRLPARLAAGAAVEGGVGAAAPQRALDQDASVET
jgi:MFS family permease